MSQVLLLTKLDFPPFWPLSQNVADALVNPYILKAQTFDVRPLLRAVEWEGFERHLPATTGLEEFVGVEFEPAEFLAAPPLSDWDDPKLAALWAGFVRPLLVTEAFRRLLLWHGTHVTPNGLETMQDVNHLPISTARRAELKADVEAERELYRGRLSAALRAYRGLSPSSTCGPTTRRPGRGGLKTFAL
jgi:hypothetical protein